MARWSASAVAVVAGAACSSPHAARSIDAPPAARDAAAPDASPTNLAWTWTFSDGGACPAGVDRVQIFTAQWTTDGVDVREPPSDPVTVPCAAGGGGVLVDDDFDYDSWLAVLTSDDRVYAVTGPTHVDVGSTASAVIDVPRGWVHVAWTLFGQTSQQALACSDVPSLDGAGGGAIELFPGASGQATATDTQPCSAGETWLALPPGGYDLTLRAVYAQNYTPAGGPDLYTLGTTTFAAQQVSADAVLDLGTQQLPLAQY